MKYGISRVLYALNVSVRLVKTLFFTNSKEENIANTTFTYYLLRVVANVANLLSVLIEKIVQFIHLIDFDFKLKVG